MSYNGSGVFNINTSGQPVVTGTVISSTAFNALTADLATGLTTALTKDGQTTPTANIPMGGFKITGVAAATTLGDALSYGRAATVSALTSSALTSGRVTYASTAGLLTDSANFVFDGTNLGIGGSPSGKLWVSGAQNANDIYINNSTTSTQLRMQMVDAQASIFTTGSYPLTFGTNNTNNRMVIDTSGNLLVGTTSVSGPATKAMVAGGRIYNTYDRGYSSYDSVNGGSTWIFGANSGTFFLSVNGGVNAVQVTDSGIVTMNAYGAGAATFSASGVISSVSDETWKIKDGLPVNPDEMLKKLKPGYWYYNDEKKEIFGKDRQLGFYAQNVNEAIGKEAAPIPEMYTVKDEDGNEKSVSKPWGYYDRSVLAVTVMSLQKALTTIEELTARLTALESK